MHDVENNTSNYAPAEESLIDTKIRRTYFLLSAGRKLKNGNAKKKDGTIFNGHTWSECSSSQSSGDVSILSDDGHISQFFQTLRRASAFSNFKSPTQKFNRKHSSSSSSTNTQHFSEGFKSKSRNASDQGRSSRKTQNFCEKMVYLIGYLLVSLVVVLFLIVTFKIHPGHFRNPQESLRRIKSRDHPGCELRFSENYLKPVPLLSFPGSGNTWLRNLLEETSGIYSALRFILFSHLKLLLSPKLHFQRISYRQCLQR